MPRVLTFESTFLRSPTPEAMLCISPRLSYTFSSRSLTSLKDFWSCVSSFSLTVFWMTSSFFWFSSCIEVSWRIIVRRIFSSFSLLEDSSVLKRFSRLVSWRSCASDA